MTEEQIKQRNAKIREYYAHESPEKREERINKIREYHATIHRKKATEKRAKVAKDDIKKVIATLQYIIGEQPTTTNKDPQNI